MNASRFRELNKPAVAPSPGVSARIKWMRLAKSDGQGIRELAAKASSSKGRRLFALVSAPAATRSGINPSRNVLIFDNHPDTLRLLSTSAPTPEVNASVWDRLSLYYLLVVALLIGLSIIAIVWPLIVR